MPYIVNRMSENGLWTAISNPRPDTRPRADWAHRMECAHKTAEENLVIFAPLALAVQVTGTATALTAGAAMVYFYARAAHLVIFVLGIPLLRTLAFAVGFAAPITLGLSLLGVV